MEKAKAENFDWPNLGFNYYDLPYSFHAEYKDGKWDEGKLTSDSTIKMSEAANVLHYGQEAFEGLKAYRRKDGGVNLFRPDMNAKRLHNSAERLLMAPFPEDRFVEAVKMVVKANQNFVPPYGSGATLYIRPFIIGTGEVIGVHPADKFQFHILVTPVGPYYKGGMKPTEYVTSPYDRAAHGGTGQS